MSPSWTLARTLPLSIPADGKNPPYYFDQWIRLPTDALAAGDSISLRARITDLNASVVTAGFIVSEAYFRNDGPEVNDYYQGQAPTADALDPGGNPAYEFSVYAPDQMTIGSVTSPIWTTLETDPLEIVKPETGDTLWHHVITQITSTRQGLTGGLVRFLTRTDA